MKGYLAGAAAFLFCLLVIDMGHCKEQGFKFVLAASVAVLTGAAVAI